MSIQKLSNNNSALANGSGCQLVKERNYSSNKVKLCGYLKKKRNKVGGWRKMWFVLQDKLLLSYSSKEEYDNKLVSFKDVLNLMPGTMVRPLGGFRFTIETATHVMYTFHCDDRIAYREWITTLLDSLSATTNSKFISANSAPTIAAFASASAASPSLSPSPAASSAAYSLLPMQYQRFRNTSVDNIPHALWSNAAAQNSQRQRELSSSCDSMHQRIELADSNYDEYAYLESVRKVNVKTTTTTTTNELAPALRPALAPTLSLPAHHSNSSRISRSGGGVGRDADNDDDDDGGGDSCIGVVARLPIARSTAKILERNGVNSSGLTKKHHHQQQQQQQKHYQRRQQQQQQQQVNNCNRNSGTIVHATGSKCKSNNRNNKANDGDDDDDDNSVNSAHCATEASVTHFRLHGESTNNLSELNTMDNGLNADATGCSSSSSSSTDAATSMPPRRQPINQSVLKINSMFQQQQQSIATSLLPSSVAGAGANHCHQMANKDVVQPYPKATKTNCDQIEFIPKCNPNNKTNASNTTDRQSAMLADYYYSMSGADDAQVVDDNISVAHSCCSSDSRQMVAVKDQIQRINIKGRKEIISSYANAADTPVDGREQRRIVVTKRLEEETITETVNKKNMTKTIGAIAKAKSLENDVTTNVEEWHCDTEKVATAAATKPCNRSSEPIYAVVDLAHKYAQRQQRSINKNNLKSLDSNRCRSYESIIQSMEPCDVAAAAAEIKTTGSRRSVIEKSESNLHEDDIDGIYEDGDKFVGNCEPINGADEDENIYEPVGFHNNTSQKINSTPVQPNALWRYITRLKVNSLLQFTRMRRNNHVDYDTLHLPNTPSLSPSPTFKKNYKKSKITTIATKNKKQTTIVTPTATASQFASIKHKFGAHRKSMQVRVRKICARRNYEPKVTKTTYSKNNNKSYTKNSDEYFVAASANGKSCDRAACNGTMNGVVGGVDGVVGTDATDGVDGVVKKSKYRWKSVKIRPKQFNGSSCNSSSNCSSTNSSTTDNISNTKAATNETITTATKRQRFFGSLPHLRKARVSLFSTPNLLLTAAKDQNSNLSEIVDKAATDADVGYGRE